MKRILLIIGISLCVSEGFTQVADSASVDVVELIVKKFNINFKESKREKRNVHFSLFPTQSGVPGGGRALVTSFNAAFYLGEKSTTRISSVYFVPYITFTGKYGFLVRPSLWLPNNKGNLSGDYRILKYPQYTWGLGGNSDEESTVIDNNYFRFYQYAVKNIGKNWNVGAGYMLDHHYNIAEVDTAETGGYLKTYSTGADVKTTSSGIAFPIAYDLRTNSINPQGGAYFLASYRFNTPALGSDHTWHSIYIDCRKYVSFSASRQNILAFRSYYWTVLSGRVPYLDLPSIGWDLALIPSGRGIQQGRYRSNALLYFESEYRFDITANGLLGAVLFSNVSSASEFDTQNFNSWHAAVGTGLRIKFNKYSRTNILFDFAMSKDYMGLYLNIGEAF